MESSTNQFIRSGNQINFTSLPHFIQDQVIHPLPPLPFFKPAQEPLNSPFWSSDKQKQASTINNFIKIQTSLGGNKNIKTQWNKQQRQMKNVNEYKQIRNSVLNQAKYRQIKRNTLSNERQLNNERQCRQMQKLRKQINERQCRQMQKLRKQINERQCRQMQKLRKQINEYKEKYYLREVNWQCLVKKNNEQKMCIEELMQRNHKLQTQIDDIKYKKRSNSRISLGSVGQHKKNNIPVIKITVPNFNNYNEATISPNTHSHPIQSTNRSSSNHTPEYHQLAQQLHLIKLQKEELKAELIKIKSQITNITNQNQYLRESKDNQLKNNQLKNNQLRMKQISQQLRRSQMQRQLQKVEVERYVSELGGLRNQIQHLESIIILKDERIQENQKLSQINSNLQKEINIINEELAVAKHKTVQETAKKISSKSNFNQYPHTKQKQLNDRNIEEPTLGIMDKNVKQMMLSFMEKINQLSEQINSIKKIKQYQDFQLKRLYELIKNKKQELQTSYQQNLKLKKTISIMGGKQSSNLDKVANVKNYLF